MGLVNHSLGFRVSCVWVGGIFFVGIKKVLKFYVVGYLHKVYLHSNMVWRKAL